MQKSNGAFDITLAAVLSALTFLFTSFLKIPIGLGAGYIHLGDAVIFIACILLPPRYAALSAAVGSSLADLVYYPPYAVPTFIIKGLTALTAAAIIGGKTCAEQAERSAPARLIVAFALAGTVTLAGYFIFELGYYYLLEESFPTALTVAASSLLIGALQPLAGAAIAVPLSPVLRSVRER